MRRLACTVCSVCLLLSPLLSHGWTVHQGLTPAAPGTMPAPDRLVSVVDADAGAPPVSPQTEQKVRQFLDRFVDADKTPAEQAALFAEDADYYEQGAVGRKAIRRDVERYVKHWPQRRYRVADISYITPDPLTDDRVFVAYTIDFEVANGARSIRGKANYGAVIGNLDDAPQVEAIKERVRQRRADPSSSGQ